MDDLDQIAFLLGRAYYSYIGLLQRRLEEEGLSGRLKPGMGSLLFALFREDGRSPSALAAELGLARSTLTGLLARMREAGVVDVRGDDRDGRAARVRLTPRARALRPRCVRLAKEMEALLGRGLPRAERERLRRDLKHVTRNITERLSELDRRRAEVRA